MNVLTRLWAGQSGARVLAGAMVIYFFQHIQTGSVGHRSFYLIGTGVSSRRYNGRGVKLTTHHHEVEIYSGWSISLYRLYALMDLTGRTSLFYM